MILLRVRGLDFQSPELRLYVHIPVMTCVPVLAPKVGEKEYTLHSYRDFSILKHFNIPLRQAG